MRINLGQTKGNLPDQSADAGFAPFPQVRGPKDNRLAGQRKLNKAPVFDVAESPKSQDAAVPKLQEKDLRPLDSNKSNSVTSRPSQVKLQGRLTGGAAYTKDANRGTDGPKSDSKNLSGLEESEDKSSDLEERLSRAGLPLSVDASQKPVIPSNPPVHNQGNTATGDKANLNTSILLDPNAKQFGQPEMTVGSNISSGIGINAQDLMKKSPVIAFLTGHLEKVEPAEIPKLVAGTPFIQKAMQEDNLANFLDQPRNLNELLDTLGIEDPSVVSLLSAGGITESAAISARQLFDKLGVSSTRVEVELDLLKKNLTLEGVSNYMRRAQVLKSSQVGASNRGQTPSDKIIGIAPSVDSGLLADSVTKSLPSDRARDPKLADLQKTQELIGDVNSVSQEGAANGKGSGTLLGYHGPTASVGKLAGGGGNTGSQPIAGYAAKSSQVTPMMTRLQMLSEAEVSQNSSVFDQFGSMMTGSDLKSIDYSSAVSVTQEGLLRFQDILVNNAQQSPVASSPISISGNFLSKVNQQNLKIDDPDIANGNMAELSQSPGFAAQTNFVALGNRGATQAKFGLHDASDERGEVLQPILEQKDGMVVGDGLSLDDGELSAKSGADNSGRHSESGDQKFETDSNAALSHLLGNQTQKAKFMQTKPFEVQDQRGPEIAAKILEHAKASAQKGGGETILNLGDQIGGQLDVAIRVVDNRVDIRILTNSDDLRNAMFSDLNRLTESLSQHKLSMGKVEVGLNHQFSTNNQQFGQGGFTGRQDTWQSHREQLRDVSTIRDLARRSGFGYGLSEGRIGAIRSPYVSKHPNGGFIAVA